jgi:hypothetical protein
MNSHGLAILVVNELDFRQFDEDRLAGQFELHLAGAADDLLWRNAIDLLGEDPHEIHAAARNDKRLESYPASTAGFSPVKSASRQENKH